MHRDMRIFEAEFVALSVDDPTDSRLGNVEGAFADPLLVDEGGGSFSPAMDAVFRRPKRSYNDHFLSDLISDFCDRPGRPLRSCGLS